MNIDHDEPKRSMMSNRTSGIVSIPQCHLPLSNFVCVDQDSTVAARLSLRSQLRSLHIYHSGDCVIFVNLVK
jgi:hypothetical protein